MHQTIFPHAQFRYTRQKQLLFNVKILILQASHLTEIMNQYISIKFHGQLLCKKKNITRLSLLTKFKNILLVFTLWGEKKNTGQDYS